MPSGGELKGVLVHSVTSLGIEDMISLSSHRGLLSELVVLALTNDTIEASDTIVV